MYAKVSPFTNQRAHKQMTILLANQFSNLVSVPVTFLLFNRSVREALKNIYRIAPAQEQQLPAPNCPNTVGSSSISSQPRAERWLIRPTRRYCTSDPLIGKPLCYRKWQWSQFRIPIFSESQFRIIKLKCVVIHLWFLIDKNQFLGKDSNFRSWLLKFSSFLSARPSDRLLSAHRLTLYIEKYLLPSGQKLFHTHHFTVVLPRPFTTSVC